jgi:dephospho-CoA kinase
VQRRILGLTGPNAAGKGEVAAYLAELGFEIHSLSDVVRAAAAERGFPTEREHLIRIGNELRREGGPGALAEGILPALGQRAVVDSIRNPAEVEVLRGVPGFVLLGVTAPVERRFERSSRRARPGDPATLAEFVARERQENADDPTSQQLDATLRLADHVIDNRGELAELRARVDAILAAMEGTG